MEMWALIYEFPTQIKASQAYKAVRNIIYTSVCELSTYRLTVNGVWHVLVVGDQPSCVLTTPLRKALKCFGGRETTMPTDAVEQLYLRHFQKTVEKGANWSEQSHR